MNDSNEQELCVRIVLREPCAAEIHQTASKVSDPGDKDYGQYETRETIAKWGNPSAETRQKVLTAFGGVHEPSLLDDSPLLFVKGEQRTFERLFQGRPLDRIDPLTSPVVQIRSWEWNEALSEFEHAVKTVHVSLLRDGTKGQAAPRIVAGCFRIWSNNRDAGLWVTGTVTAPRLERARVWRTARHRRCCDGFTTSPPGTPARAKRSRS